MTEDAEALVAHGLMLLDLHKIEAMRMTRNSALERVLEKIGMTREGLLRGHIPNNSVPEDLAVYGLLNSRRKQA